MIAFFDEDIKKLRSLEAVMIKLQRFDFNTTHVSYTEQIKTNHAYIVACCNATIITDSLVNNVRSWYEKMVQVIDNNKGFYIALIETHRDELEELLDDLKKSDLPLSTDITNLLGQQETKTGIFNEYTFDIYQTCSDVFEALLIVRAYPLIVQLNRK